MMTGSHKKMGKFALQATIGGVAGFGASWFGLRSPWFDGLVAWPGALALAAVGLVYLLMGLFVGMGSLSPQLGARLLNVADVEEAQDERPMLLGSGVVFVALGVAQLLLALAVSAQGVPAAVAVTAMSLALTLCGVITWLQWARYDELIKQVSWEAAGISLSVLTVILVGWAMLAQFSSGVAIDPAGLIAVLMGVILLGTFIAVGRRGMLTPA